MYFGVTTVDSSDHKTADSYTLWWLVGSLQMKINKMGFKKITDKAIQKSV